MVGEISLKLMVDTNLQKRISRLAGILICAVKTSSKPFSEDLFSIFASDN